MSAKLHEEYEFYECIEEKIDVDIAMITYNHEQYIEEAIESILSQKTKYKYRIVIGEDCSTDGTRKLVLEYYKKYPDKISLILWKENVGMTRNASAVLKELHADIVACLEGDDYWTDYYKLEKQVNFLKNNSDYIGTAHNVRCVDYEGNFLYNNQHYLIEDEHIYDINAAKKMKVMGQTASYVYRNIWKNATDEEWRLFNSGKVNGDLVISVLLGLNGKVFFFKDIMADHRRCFYGDSWTASTVNKNILWDFYNSRKILSEYISNRTGENVFLDEYFYQLFQESKQKLLTSFNKENLSIYLKFFMESIYIKKRINIKGNTKKNQLKQCKISLNRSQNIIRIYNMWMMIIQSGYTISQYLKLKNINTVVIYGMGNLGVRFFHELENSSITVLYGLDKNPKVSLPNLSIYRIGEEKKEESDLVVVTAVSSFGQINLDLKTRGYENIVGLDEILQDILKICF